MTFGELEEMATARLMSNWDLMASLQYQLGLFMSKDEAASKALKFEDFHPLRQEVRKKFNKDSKLGFEVMKILYNKKVK